MSEIEKKIDKECLFTCRNTLDSNEYRKMIKYFPKKTYWKLIIRSINMNICFSLAVYLVTLKIMYALVFFVFYQILLMILYKVNLGYYVEKIFNANMKKGIIDTEAETEFYDTFLIKKTKTMSIKVKYSEIGRCIENNTNFYLEYPLKNTIILLQKDKCSFELINFIRTTFKDLENYSDNND